MGLIMHYESIRTRYEGSPDAKWSPRIVHSRVGGARKSLLYGALREPVQNSLTREQKFDSVRIHHLSSGSLHAPYSSRVIWVNEPRKTAARPQGLSRRRIRHTTK